MRSREAVTDRRISGVEDQRITCQPVQQSSISEWQRMPNGWLQHLKHSRYYIKIPQPCVTTLNISISSSTNW
jgi:hypothetical protein